MQRENLGGSKKQKYSWKNILLNRVRKLVEELLLGIKYLQIQLPDTQSTNLRGKMKDRSMTLKEGLGEGGGAWRGLENIHY